MEDQLHLSALMQAHWADNQVSSTISFHKDEDVAGALKRYETKLKGISFLPWGDGGYKQMPYETITKEEYEKRKQSITKVDMKEDAIQERYCDGELCWF